MSLEKAIMIKVGQCAADSNALCHADKVIEASAIETAIALGQSKEDWVDKLIAGSASSPQTE